MRRIFDRSRIEACCGPLNAYHIVSAILPWVLFFGTAIALIVGWGRIPEQVPMHADFQGNVTGWGPKSTLIILGAVYLVINLTLWIVAFFPQSWNNGGRLRSVRLGGRKPNTVREYRLTLDLLCDLRLSMALLFSGLLLWSAFGDPDRFPIWINAGVFVLIGLPLARYLIRLYWPQ